MEDIFQVLSSLCPAALGTVIQRAPGREGYDCGVCAVPRGLNSSNASGIGGERRVSSRLYFICLVVVSFYFMLI